MYILHRATRPSEILMSRNKKKKINGRKTYWYANIARRSLTPKRFLETDVYDVSLINYYFGVYTIVLYCRFISASFAVA